MNKKKGLNRRDFISKAARAGLGTGIGLSVLPSRVLGGPGKTSPNDKINVGLIGFGAQSYKMLPDWLNTPEFQFISVCDPNRQSYDYPNWGRPQGELMGFPGGREVGKQLIENYYSRKHGSGKYKGCSTYTDFRVMLEEEEDLDAVFIMTPDHLHAHIAVAALNKGLMVSSHKPIGNFLYEIRRACETAKQTGLNTHLFAHQDHKENYHIKEWIKEGVIGEVKELHRWTNRPMWPQGSPNLPTNRPPVPEGFDWDLWLGPSLPREYSPDYTHALFRGWHEFGAGCLADMGYYGFLVDWRVLNLGIPDTVEASANVVCDLSEFRSSWITNKVSFPNAATVQWEVPVKDSKKSVDVFWYEGGLRPPTPKVMRDEGRRLSAEGVMYVGEKGAIVAAYGYGNPEIIGIKNADKIIASINVPDDEPIDFSDEMVESFKSGKESRGSYQNSQAVAETIGIGNIAIRADQEFRADQRLKFDLKNLKVTNMEEANKFIRRETRPGWEI